MPALPNFGTYPEKPAVFALILNPAENEFET